MASGQLQSSDGVKSCYELKDIPSEVPVPPPMPCDDEIRPSTSMLKLRRHKKPPHHMSSDCLQVQGSQQESHSTLSKRWSFPYFEGVQNTLMGQSKLNGDTTTSSFSTVRCKSSDEYSHEEQFGVAEVEKGVRKNTTFHCQDTANLCSSQEEKRKANKGKQSPCMNTSSIKVSILWLMVLSCWYTQ